MRALLIGHHDYDLIRIKRVLESHGWCTSHSEWLHREDDHSRYGLIDIIIISTNEGSPSPSELLTRLRSNGETAVIMVLGEFSVDERIKALGLGADDFLRRDEPGAIVLSRALALLRLRSKRFQPNYRIGNLEIDLIHRHATRAGSDLSLSQTEFQLLVLLAQNADSTLSRSDIIEHLWADSRTADDNTLDAHVSRLRRKLDSPFPDKMLFTIRGVGYRLTSPEEARAPAR